MKIISLYTGAGGLDLGFEAAGYETAVAVEMDEDCCKTIRANRNWPLFEGSIHDVKSDELLEMASLKSGEADLLIGGPPCQPFSKSSYWVRGDTLRLGDPRADTLSAYLRVLRDTKPRAFVLENVFGLVYKNKDEGLKLILKIVEDINKSCRTNYRVYWRVLQATDYGVPQKRERVFLVACRDGKEFNFSHSSPKVLRNAWDAIGGLSDPKEELSVGGKWGELLPSIPEGFNYLWHTSRGGGMNLFGWRTRYWSFLLKLAKSKPSWTIQAHPGSSIGPFHWKNRKLSVQEMCRLQTFPEDYKIFGGRTSCQRQLGNAVPSLLAEVIGREIKKQFFGKKFKDPKLKLSLPKRIPVPDAESIKKVPRKYFVLTKVIK